MSSSPVIDEEYLCRILRLPDSPVDKVEITAVNETNTALAIKAAVHITESEAHIKKLFIKTVRHTESEKSYHGMSMNEGKFYKFVRNYNVVNLPVPVCYDVFISDETGEFLIVLEDLSDRYIPADKKRR